MRVAARALVTTLALALATACAATAGGVPTPDGNDDRVNAGVLDAARAPGDREARRRTLEASLVNRDNGYARLRLAHYATGDAEDWDALPERNPPTSVWGADDETLTPLIIDEAARLGDPRALRDLGEAAFFRYPAQISPAVDRFIVDEASARAHGFWIDEKRGIGGLVKVRTPDGVPHLSFTCASCHVQKRGDTLLIGAGNDTFDLGKLMAREGSHREAHLAWGPGRVDVTTTEGTEPVRIPDLRPTRDLTFLHHTASVRQNDLATLAIRLETLIIVSNGRTFRPPRTITLAMATYLWSLADTLPSSAPASDAETRGAVVFARECAACHTPPHYGGGAVPIETVGTDPHLGRSRDRGTGNYRVPSLRGVSTRGLLLHDGSAPSIDVLFDPGRTAPGFVGAHGRAVTGHTFGLSLPQESRADLLAFLRTL